ADRVGSSGTHVLADRADRCHRRLDVELGPRQHLGKLPDASVSDRRSPQIDPVKHPASLIGDRSVPRYRWYTHTWYTHTCHLSPVSVAHTPRFVCIGAWSVPGLVHTWICVSSPAMWCAAVVRVAECGLTWGGGL